MIEGVDFTVSYQPVTGILSLCIIIATAYAECLILFVLDISNAFQNIILCNNSERVHLSLPYDVFHPKMSCLLSFSGM